MKDQRRIEAELERRHGMPDTQREEMNAALAKMDDWYTTCRKCGIRRSGTIAQLKGPCECQQK